MLDTLIQAPSLPELLAMRPPPVGMHAAIICEVTKELAEVVILHKGLGGQRVVVMLIGERLQLPRIS
jgi:hypothetical protein